MAQGIGPRVRSVLLAAAVGTALLLPLVATAANTTPDGIWVGTMKTAEGEDFEVTLTINGSGSSWSGTLKDPFMGEVALQNLTVTATRISFFYRPANVPFPATFSGSYLAAKDRITGTFSMRGTSRFVKFERSPIDLGAGPNAEAAAPAEPERERHAYSLAVTGRMSWWPSLHVVKAENHNLNNLTAAAANFDAALKWSVVDEFTVYGRYYRGGQNFTDNTARLDRYADIGLTADSYLKLDGWELGITGYLGNLMMRNSRFNPYLTAAVGKVSWELDSSGRGSDIIVLERNALEGSTRPCSSAWAPSTSCPAAPTSRSPWPGATS